MIGNTDVLGTDLRLVIRSAISTLHIEVLDRHSVAIVLIRTSDRDLDPLDPYIVDDEIPRPAVGRTVSARPPEFSEIRDVRILDNRLGSRLGVVLKHLVCRVQCNDVIECHRRAIFGVRSRILANVLPIDILERAVTFANNAVTPCEAAGDDQIPHGDAIFDLKHRHLALSVLAVSGVIYADALILEVPHILAAVAGVLQDSRSIPDFALAIRRRGDSHGDRAGWQRAGRTYARAFPASSQRAGFGATVRRGAT